MPLKLRSHGSAREAENREQAAALKKSTEDIFEEAAIQAKLEKKIKTLTSSRNMIAAMPDGPAKDQALEQLKFIEGQAHARSADPSAQSVSPRSPRRVPTGPIGASRLAPPEPAALDAAGVGE